LQCGAVVLKLPLTIIFYIYACHRKDLHLLSHFVRLTLSYCGILCSIRIDRPKVIIHRLSLGEEETSTRF
jgi:hypothetical protein